MGDLTSAPRQPRQRLWRCPLSLDDPDDMGPMAVGRLFGTAAAVEIVPDITALIHYIVCILQIKVLLQVGMIGGDESIEHRDSYSCPALHLRPGKGQVDSGKVPLPIVFWIVGDRGQLEFRPRLPEGKPGSRCPPL